MKLWLISSPNKFGDNPKKNRKTAVKIKKNVKIFKYLIILYEYISNVNFNMHINYTIVDT